jgi:hypothetical protein
MFCLCLRQSGLWILDVARPVGRALKDDGKVGECVFEVKSRKVDCRVTLFLAMTLAEEWSVCHEERGAMTLAEEWSVCHQ